MTSMRDIINELMGREISLRLEDGELKFRAPRGALTKEMAAKLKQNKPALIAFLAEQASPRQVQIEPAPEDVQSCLSWAQQRLWFLDRLSNDRASYNMVSALRLKGELDVDLLEQSFSLLVDRHQILRSYYPDVEGEPQVVLNPPSLFKMIHQSIELEEDTDEHRLKAAHALVKGETQHSFDLAAEPLFRIVLGALGEQDWVLVFNMHHIISDGWSIGIIGQEFAQNYAMLSQGQTPQIPLLDIQYVDYAHWQRYVFEPTQVERQINYWRKTLDQLPPMLKLPWDRPRPLTQTTAASTVNFFISTETYNRLKQYSRQSGASLFITTAASFILLLAKFSGLRDIFIGTPVTNRNQQALESLIGMFVNTVVLRVDVDPELPFSGLVEVVKHQTLAAHKNKDVPFEQVVDELQPERSLGHSPLFQVMFMLGKGDTGDNKKMQWPGVDSEQVNREVHHAKFDLSLRLEEHPDGMNGVFDFNRDLFDDSSIKRLAEGYQCLLNSAARDPEATISNLSLMNAANTQALLRQWREACSSVDYSAPVYHTIIQQAQRNGQAIAVTDGQQTLTYNQLIARMDTLAQFLIAQGVTNETAVGVLMSRNIDVLPAMLATWKVGGAWVPMDPEYPSDRLRYIIEDARISTVITCECWLNHPCLDNIQLLVADTLNYPDVPGESAFTLPSISFDSLAYILYTSGSMGWPKGVMIPHRGLANYLGWASSAYGMADLEGALVHSSISFDATITSLFTPLMVGGCVHMINDGNVLDGLANAMLDQSRRYLFKITPAHLDGLIHHPLLQSGHSGQNIFVLGGEALPPELVTRWQQIMPGSVLINEYGPTETVVGCCVYRIEPGDKVEGRVLIGKPINHTRLYVLDERLQPVLPGTIGELYIGGRGVARGYVNLPDKTSEVFIDNPFTGTEDAVLYRSGDLVRYLPNGDLDYIGRADEQIKIRGFRIEPSEIGNQIDLLEGVRSSLVTLCNMTEQGRQLVAYVMPKSGVRLESNRLREELIRRLPDYMIPAFFIFLDEWPLTDNGKIDRKALPPPDVLDEQDSFTLPADDQENILQAIWGKLLGIEPDKLSVTVNFFAIGGHSLLATRLMARIRSELGLTLSPRAIFENPTIRQLSQSLKDAASDSLPSLITQPRSGDIPLSFAQQRLWFIEQLRGSSSLYNMPFATRIIGSLDSDVVITALEMIFLRHEVLRTTYSSVNDEPMQKIHSDLTLPLVYEDLRVVSDREDYIQNALIEEATTPFELSSDSMLRGRLLQSGDEEHVLLLTMHHIASDGVSVDVLMREFGQLLEGLSIGTDVEDILKPLPVQYADYAIWQRSWLHGEVLERQYSYWKEQLSDLPTTHSLRLDRPRPAQVSHNGDHVGLWLESDSLERLKSLAVEQDVTLFMLLHGAFALLLSRHSFEQDIVIGTPIANRTHHAIEELIGFFVNTLVLRLDVDPTANLTDYLEQVRAVHLGAQEHQDIPFELLVEQLNPERSQQHTPLFQIMMNYLRIDMQSKENARSGGLSFETLGGGEPVAKFELTLTVSEYIDGSHSRLCLDLNYATELFDRGTIEQLIENFHVLLIGLLDKHDSMIGNLPMLTESDKVMAMRHAQPLLGDYPTDRLLHEIVEEYAVEMPNQTALVCDERYISYQALNETANQLAHYLRKCGVGSSDPVWLCMDRSIESVTSQLAILKAGGAYVPLDPDYPAERLNTLMGNHKFNYLLGQARTLSRLKIEPQVAQIITLDAPDVISTIKVQPTFNLNRLAEQETNSLAYIMFTSGSTGQPKGVMTPHIGVVRLLVKPNFMELDSTTRFLNFSTHAFDASTLEIWGPLLNGGCCVIYPNKRIDIDELNQVIHRESVTSMFCTSGLFDKWSEQCHHLESLRWVVAGGDVVSPLAVQRVYASIPNVTVVNGYGPTENTTFTTCCRISPEHGLNSIPVGLPVTGTSTFVLSPTGSLVPPGCVGELYSGGDGLALGYHNRPDLTEEAFIDNPFGKGKLYRTGDLVWQADDGQLMFVGRADTQVKVRGFRVEPSEIMYHIDSIEGVISSLVQVIGDTAADKQLVAWLVVSKDNPPTWETLRTELAERVPEHMMPSFFQLLASWPLTANGKIDRKALPKPEAISQQGEYVAASSETEQHLVELWADLLKVPVDELSATANFFAIGGHSLLATRLMTRIRKAFDVEISVRAVFENPTIRKLALVLNQTDLSAKPPLIVQERGEVIPLSFAQQRLWFIEQLRGSSSLYNMPFATRIIGSLDSDVVITALEMIFLRHEVLRTTYSSVNDEPMQKIHSDLTLPLVYEDLRVVSDREDYIQNALIEEATTPFELSSDSMLRGRLLQSGDEEHVLLLTMHHIASDGVSMDVLMREFGQLLEGLSIGTDVEDILKPLPVQYADYAIWQRSWLHGEVLERQYSYWKEQLSDLPTTHSLRLDRPRPAQVSHNGDHVGLWLESDSLERLKSLAVEQDVTLFMLLHGAFALLLSRHSFEQDIVIGTPIANRTHHAIEELVGFFVNTLVLRLDVDPTANLTDYLEQVRAVHLGAQEHQDIPFELLVEQLNPERSQQHTPLFQIMMNYLRIDMQSKENARSGGLSFETLGGGEPVAKFELTLTVSEYIDGSHSRLCLDLNYATELFDRESILAMLERLLRLLEGLAQSTGDSIPAALPLLSDVEFKAAVQMSDVAQCNDILLTEFEKVVATQPQAKAVYELSGDALESIHFGELNHRANQLANLLVNKGVVVGERVGLISCRSIDLLVGVVGILKAGGVYVPLDPSYPDSRLSYMIKDSHIKIVVSDDEHFYRVKYDQIMVVSLSDSMMATTQLKSAPVLTISGEHPAYVIYTSGSTGEPKGVEVSHSALFNLSNNISSWPLSNKGWGLTVACGFDASLQGICQLLVGRPLTIISEEQKVDNNVLARILELGNVGVMDCTPGLVEVWFREGLSKLLPDLLIGGEAIPGPLWQQLVKWQKQTGRTALNVYGPTECCVDSTWCVIEGDKPHIGKTLEGANCHVLDMGGQPVAPGVPGELYIGGAGLAIGYVNKPELTTEAFIDNPFGEGRLYRTADKVQQNKDGTLCYLGRTDDQIKLRGYRIEPGEITNQINSLDGVFSSYVMIVEELLVGYVIAKPEVIVMLAELLSNRLPEYMIPTVFVAIDGWPLTANGKIDRKALPKPEAISQQGEYVAASSETEQHLVELWADLLKVPVDELSATANFFAIGGHSLLAMRMLSRVRKKLSIVVSVTHFWQHQCVRDLARFIDEQDICLSKKGALVRLNPDSREELAPVFCIPGVGGNAAEFSDIATCLSNRAVWGIQPSGLDGTIAADSILVMAARYVDEMIDLGLSQRPVFIGHSMGASVACAMAQRLAQYGLPPLQFIIVDAKPPSDNLRKSSTSEQIEEVFHLLSYRLYNSITKGVFGGNIDSAKLMSLAQKDLDKGLEYLLQVFGGDLVQPEEIVTAKELVTTYQRHLKAFERYRIRAPLMLRDCQVYYVAANNTPKEKTYKAYVRWQEIFVNAPEKLVISYADGDHFEVLKGTGGVVISQLVNK